LLSSLVLLWSLSSLSFVRLARLSWLCHSQFRIRMLAWNAMRRGSRAPAVPPLFLRARAALFVSSSASPQARRISESGQREGEPENAERESAAVSASSGDEPRLQPARGRARAGHFKRRRATESQFANLLSLNTSIPEETGGSEAFSEERRRVAKAIAGAAVRDMQFSDGPTEVCVFFLSPRSALLPSMFSFSCSHGRQGNSLSLSPPVADVFFFFWCVSCVSFGAVEHRSRRV
jgi:hypothetical protein